MNILQIDFFRGKIIEKIADCLNIAQTEENLRKLEKIVMYGNENYCDYAIFLLSLANFTDNLEESAKKIIESFENSDFEVKRIGKYINFTIKNDALFKHALNTIFLEKENYGKVNIGKGRTVIVEYSSPNIAKPFSIGHLRSTVIGDSLKRIYNYLGYKTIGINYLGDYGTQFGKLIYAYKYLAEKNKEELLRKNGINYLVRLYVKYHKIEKENPQIEEKAREEFKKLENNDPENTKLWKLFREISFQEFKRIYSLLEVDFDAYESESENSKELKKVIKLLQEKNILIESKGAQVVDLEKYHLGKAIILKSDQTTIYLSRDLCTLVKRKDMYNFDKMIYVVGSEQKLHFKQLFKIAELLNINAELYHVDFGLYRLKEGKMSTREGRVVYMEDVIKKVIEKVKKIINEKNVVKEDIDETARKLAISAIKFNDLSQDRNKDIVFDEEVMLKINGDTGIYLNYTLVRANGIIEKIKSKEIRIKKEYKSFEEACERKLMKHLYLYPKILIDTIEAHKPHILAQYLLKCAKLFNDFYEKVNVLKSKDIEEKMLLVLAFMYVMRSGMQLLGLPCVYKM
ncbi:MAG: arginine--tRNA ligase [Candidatus Woesearchaeota archaeon]